MDHLDGYAEEIKNLFRSISKKFRQYIIEQMGEQHFTVPQLMVLQELYNHPGIALKELSEQLSLAKSTVCGIVDRLELQGAVIRTRDTEDRRNVKISLAPKMSELSETVNMVKKNYLAGLLKDVDPAEVEKILWGLRKLDSLTNLTEDQNKGE